MNRAFRGFGAILYKEFISILRDRTTLFFMFIPPIMQLLPSGLPSRPTYGISRRLYTTNVRRRRVAY